MSEIKAKGWRYEHTVILVNFFIWGFVAFDRLLIANLFPWVLPALNINFTQAGLIMSVLSVTWALSAVVMGGLSDKVGRRAIILPVTVAFSLLSWISGLATGLLSLLGVRAAMGFAEGAYYPAAVAIVAEESTPSRRGFNIGLFQSAFAVLGMFVCPIYATRVAASLGWRWALFLTLIPGIILAVVFSRFIREPASTAAVIKARKEGKVLPAGERTKWSDLFKYHNVVVGCCINVFLDGWFTLFASFGMLFLTNVRHFAPGTAGVMMSVWGIGAFFGYLGLTWLSDQIGRKPAIMLGGFLAAIATYYMAYVAMGATSITVGMFLMGFFGLGLYPLIGAVVPFEAVPPTLAGASAGLVNFMGGILGATVIVTLGGLLADRFGLPVTMLASAVCAFIIAVIASALRESAPKVLARRAAKLDRVAS